jgi:hypothetical protein
MLTDNSALFIDWVKVCVEYSSPASKVEVKESLLGKRFVIEPGNMNFKQDLIDNLLAISRHLGQKIIFSSSLSISPRISFLIEDEAHMN